MKQKLAEGDTATALKLAEKAFALKPRHEETQDILLRLQAEQPTGRARADAGRQAEVRHAAARRLPPARRRAALGKRRRASSTRQASIEAREAAIEANRLSPDLIPPRPWPRAPMSPRASASTRRGC
jgi:HemY protein